MDNTRIKAAGEGIMLMEVANFEKFLITGKIRKGLKQKIRLLC